MFSKAEAKHIFLCYFYNRLSFFRCKKAKGAQEPKAQTTEAYPGFHEYASKYRRVPPPPPSSSCGMSSVSIYTPRRRETEWSELRNGRDLNPGPPDPEFEVLTARLQTRLHECALSCKSIALSNTSSRV